jgi:SAM-dependent methyltransferase
MRGGSGLPTVNLGEIEALLSAHPLVAAAQAELQQAPDGAVKIVASVVPAAQAYEAPQNLVKEYTDTWRRVHDTKYEPEPDDPTWDTGVWVDSYRMQPIPDGEMREWTDETVARILRLKPRRILEIGCGSGLLLYRLAPHCVQYVGIDFSKRVIDRLSADIARRPAELGHVKVFHREAEAIDDFADAGFDLVIMNSVIFFLPSTAHVDTVLDRALRTLGPNGQIFVGDVRDLSSLELFHLTVALANMPAQSTAEQLTAATQRSLSNERQMPLPPSYFARFAAGHPQISGLRIDLKHGLARNEMNRFRFDATLATAPTPGIDTAIDIVDGRKLTLEVIRSLLTINAGRRIKISSLRNARLASEAALLSRLSSRTAGGTNEVVSLPAPRGVDPSAVAAMANDLGFDCSLQPSEDLDPAAFNAILWPRGETEPRLVWQFQTDARQTDARDDINGQFRARLERNLVKTLSSYISLRGGQSAPTEIKIVRRIDRTRHDNAVSTLAV